MLAGGERNFDSASPRLIVSGSGNSTAWAPNSGPLNQRVSLLKSTIMMLPATSCPLRSVNSPDLPSTNGPVRPSGGVWQVRTRLGHRG